MKIIKNEREKGEVRFSQYNKKREILIFVFCTKRCFKG